MVEIQIRFIACRPVESGSNACCKKNRKPGGPHKPGTGTFPDNHFSGFRPAVGAGRAVVRCSECFRGKEVSIPLSPRPVNLKHSLSRNQASPGTGSE